MKGSLFIVLTHQKGGGEISWQCPINEDHVWCRILLEPPELVPALVLPLPHLDLPLPTQLAGQGQVRPIRVYTRITLRPDTGQPPPPCPSSYIEKTHPTSPRSVCSILPYLSVCIIDHRAGGERLCESSQCKTTGGAARSLGQTLQNVTNFHTRRNRQKI